MAIKNNYYVVDIIKHIIAYITLLFQRLAIMFGVSHSSVPVLLEGFCLINVNLSTLELDNCACIR